MQLRGLVAVVVFTLAAAACGDSTDITVEDLVGVWNATNYQYSNNANPNERVDLVAQGASFQMTVSADGTVSTLLDDGQGSTSSDSGTLNPTGTTLTIAGIAFEAERSGHILTLTDETNSYDIDDDGSDEDATLVIQLARQQR